MAKIPKFNLTMDGALVRSIEELQNNFSVDDILDHFESKRLHNWLNSRGYTEYLTKVEAIADEDKTAIIKPLMDIFEIDYSDKDLADILDQLKYVPTSLSRNALVPVTAAQADSDKSPVVPPSKELSSSVNLDYESQKYDELVNEIIHHPENLELIKKNIDLLASKYYAIYSRDAFKLLWKIRSSPEAVLAILDNPKAIKPFLDVFLFNNKYYNKSNYRDALEYDAQLFNTIIVNVLTDSVLSENYKFFAHIKKAQNGTIINGSVINLLSTFNMCLQDKYSYLPQLVLYPILSFAYFNKITLTQTNCLNDYMFYIDLSDYDIPKEYSNYAIPYNPNYRLIRN